MKNKTLEFCVLVALVAFIVAARLLPHPPNFTPVAAVALFSGYFFRRGSIGVAAVVVGMVLSDAFLGFYDIRIMGVVYASLLCPLMLHRFLRGPALPLRIAIGALSSSTVFFLATNAAVWRFSGMYSNTFSGLRDCFIAAIPFARFTFLGDLFWSTSLFGLYGAALLFRGYVSTPEQVGISFAETPRLAIR